MGVPDMRTPIQYALSYPDRIDSTVEKLNFNKIGDLTFMAPDTDKFPCLALAYEALKIGKTMPCVLNGANEVLVEYFLKDKIEFYDIPKFIEMAMSIHRPFVYETVDEILEVDKWVRSWVKNQLK